MFLQREGYRRVDTAASLREAVSAIEQYTYDLIISDIVLEGEKGTELLRHIRETGITCPVVMITGFPNLETASEAVRFGAFDYLPKPVNKETLLKVVSQAMKYWNLELDRQTLIRRNEEYRLYLEAIFSSVKESIIAINSDYEIIRINDAGQTFLKSLLGYLPDKLEQAGDEISRACLADAHKLIEEGAIVREHIVEIQTEQNTIAVSINGAPMQIDGMDAPGAVLVVRNINQTREEVVSEESQFHGFIGKSSVMQGVYRLIENVGKVETSVLVTGESGTGKELAAEALHAESPRKNMPLIKMDCASLPEDLVESELFGHRKGAFTGADKDRPGRLYQADGGTLFLDEIGDITPRMQLRLLRFLQEMTFTPVGMDSSVTVDVRIIAATNVNLKELVSRGLFREDLYYRLNIVEIHLPPLRERPECLPLLIQYFITLSSQKIGKNIDKISDSAQKLMAEYYWPGNVRELRHVIERGCVLCKGNSLMIEHLPAEILAAKKSTTPFKSSPGQTTPFENQVATNPIASSQSSPEPAIGKRAEQLIIEALIQAEGNKSRAAKALGIDRSTLYRKIKRYQIDTSTL
ncbi:MAG: response regulator [Desulfobulbaceae bacterium]|nr:MAG: response regulator [Desulfobulbaceae bacterium]